ncbi:MAG: MFS transporter [Bacilli bacterium]|jgi:predicted MFS family arabinose efflux permease|nr:MFS transporter [Bacilli bacterium]
MEKKKKIFSASMMFIVLMAIVSLFSDMTHEGANSMNGTYESLLGASDMVISVVGGVAVLLGCSLRMFTGWLADKTKKYWLFTIIGYAIDLVAVPLLALCPRDGWVLAVSFIILEKVGKAIKKPAKDTIVSFAAKDNGIGKSFAFGEVLDQIGAAIGPMILTLTYIIRSDLSDDYEKMRLGFLVLGIPAVICMVLLILSYSKFPHPEVFEKDDDSKVKDTSFMKKPAFILFIVASCFLALGFMDSFSLINKEIYADALLPTDYLPLLYSYAMVIDAISAMVFGLLYDKIGFVSIAIATLLTSTYTFFIFYFNGLWSIFLGLTLWGIGMGAEESVMKSGITTLSGKNERARAFGTYELFYGVFVFAGSFLTGWLYTSSRLALSLLSTISILVGTVIYFISDKYRKNDDKNGPSNGQVAIDEVEKMNSKGFKSEAMAKLEETKRKGLLSDSVYNHEKELINKEIV